MSQVYSAGKASGNFPVSSKLHSNQSGRQTLKVVDLSALCEPPTRLQLKLCIIDSCRCQQAVQCQQVSARAFPMRDVYRVSISMLPPLESARDDAKGLFVCDQLSGCGSGRRIDELHSDHRCDSIWTAYLECHFCAYQLQSDIIRDSNINIINDRRRSDSCQPAE